MERHFRAIPSELSFEPEIPSFLLPIQYSHLQTIHYFLQSLFTFLKIFLIKVICRGAIDLFPLGWLSSVFTPLREINPFQANFSFLYP